MSQTSRSTVRPPGSCVKRRAARTAGVTRNETEKCDISMRNLLERGTSSLEKLQELTHAGMVAQRSSEEIRTFEVLWTRRGTLRVFGYWPSKVVDDRRRSTARDSRNKRRQRNYRNRHEELPTLGGKFLQRAPEFAPPLLGNGNVDLLVLVAHRLTVTQNRREEGCNRMAQPFLQTNRCGATQSA